MCIVSPWVYCFMTHSFIIACNLTAKITFLLIAWYIRADNAIRLHFFFILVDALNAIVPKSFYRCDSWIAALSAHAHTPTLTHVNFNGWWI